MNDSTARLVTPPTCRRTTGRRRPAAFALVCVVLLGLSTIGADAKDRSFVGAWLIDATPAQNIVPPFKMLMTFHADETLVETQNDLLALPFFATTGHGAWERTGNDTYRFTMVQLLFDPNFTGTLTGMLKSSATVTVSGDTLSGAATVEVTDPSGTVLFAGSGSLAGTRIAPGAD